MGPQRRDFARESDESLERMWRLYADQIGIPDAGSAAGESLPRNEHDAVHRRLPPRHTSANVGQLVTAAAVVVVGVISSIVLWSSLSRTPARLVERQSPTVTSEPAAEVAQTRQHSTTGAKQTAEASPRRRKDVLYRVSFDFGSDRISDASLAGLDKIASSMKANQDWRLSIEGHTDAHGTPDHNQSLSERRAQAVKAYLQSSGITPERLRVAGFGASRAVAPNNAYGDALNRRVEIYRQ